MIYYAVLDTNVLVSALLSKQSDSATVQVVSRIICGEIVPVYSSKIMLVTGNLRHFPIEPFIVTARQLLDIIDGKNNG